VGGAPWAPRAPKPSANGAGRRARRPSLTTPPPDRVLQGWTAWDARPTALLDSTPAIAVANPLALGLQHESTADAEGRRCQPGHRQGGTDQEAPAGHGWGQTHFCSLPYTKWVRTPPRRRATNIHSSRHVVAFICVMRQSFSANARVLAARRATSVLHAISLIFACLAGALKTLFRHRRQANARRRARTRRGAFRAGALCIPHTDAPLRRCARRLERARPACKAQFLQSAHFRGLRRHAMRYSR
jgi:hypothetical protein